jgi:hypothetical protein
MDFNIKNCKWVDVKYIFIVLFFSKALIAQKPVDDSVINQLKNMANRDQEHRKIVLGPELWKKFKSQPQSYQDSMHVLMQRADSINFIEYIKVVKEYGFIDSKKCRECIMGTMILHFISHEEVAVLEPLLYQEVISGRMPGLLYAQWYDRYLLGVCNKRELYGEYGRIGKFPCVDNLEETNEARKKIGLPPFKKSKCNEKH